MAITLVCLSCAVAITLVGYIVMGVSDHLTMRAAIKRLREYNRQ